MTLKELRARLGAIKKEMKALLDQGFTAENKNEAKFDELESEANQVRSNIEKMEKFEKFEQDCQADEQPRGRQTTPDSFEQPATARDNRTQDPECGFKGVGEFVQAVRLANPKVVNSSVDERLKIMGAPTNFHRETSSDDGYMVPPEYKDKIFELMFNEPDLLNMVDAEPTSSNQVEFNADESTPWGSTGIQGYWGNEGGQLTKSRLSTEGRQIKLNKLHAYVLATEELLEDAPRLNRRVTAGAARAMNWKANEAILYGTGSGQPLGFDTGGSKISVAKESGQSADTVVANNVSKMYSRNMNPGRSVWLMNQDVLPQIMTLVVGNQPIWVSPQSGFANAPGGFLLGRQIMFSDQCKTLGDNNDIMFVDPMGYYLAKKTSGIKFNSSIHLYFDYDVSAFKWTFRLGGAPYLQSAVSPANGSSTRSHFVTLAERA